MAIPKKASALKPSFKRYVLYEGGWKRIAKLSLGFAVSVIATINFGHFYKISKTRKRYSDGSLLHELGVKGSEVGPLYYNDNRSEDEKIKCSVDTKKKLPYGQTYCD
jgi:hypothetical protein